MKNRYDVENILKQIKKQQKLLKNEGSLEPDDKDAKLRPAETGSGKQKEPDIEASRKPNPPVGAGDKPKAGSLSWKEEQTDRIDVVKPSGRKKDAPIPAEAEDAGRKDILEELDARIDAAKRYQEEHADRTHAGMRREEERTVRLDAVSPAKAEADRHSMQDAQAEQQPLRDESSSQDETQKKVSLKDLFDLEEYSRVFADDDQSKETPSLREKREEKIKEFTVQIPSEDSNEEPPRMDEEDIDEDICAQEYETDEDAPHIRGFFRQQLKKLTIRAFANGALLLLISYLTCGAYSLLPMPAFLDPFLQPLVYLSVYLGLVVVSAGFNFELLMKGLDSLFTLKANHDSLLSVAAVAVVVQQVTLLIFQNRVDFHSVHLFAPFLLIGLLFSIWGKWMNLGRMEDNFDVISRDGEKYAGVLVDKSLAVQLTKGLNLEEPVVVTDIRADFLSGFMEISTSRDTVEKILRLLAPCCLVGSIAVLIAMTFISGDILVAINVFTALCCIAAPFTSTLASAIPLRRAGKRLNRMGAAASGTLSMDLMYEANTVLFEAGDLFESDGLCLHGVKMFEESRIDEALIGAASVFSQCNDGLTHLFMNILRGNKKLLQQVEGLQFREGLGVSGYIDGKEILIGNRRMMNSNAIPTPAQELERRMRENGRSVLYIAKGRDLLAMLVYSYHPSKQVVRALQTLEEKGFMIVINTWDCNLSAQMLADLTELQLEGISTAPSKTQEKLCQLRQPRKRLKGMIAHTGSKYAFVRSLISCIYAKNCEMLLAVLSTISSVIGYVLIVFLSMSGAIGQVTVLSLLLFHGFFALVILLIGRIKRI
ncbi:hypothetical protein [Candidatus Soleaferrea massiliensis]|uniref:hypothetical protein n=1 Tax=Candidatus Soleaferrea massiliensis TaxID=1470354 RepID=UPI00058BF280|nr:hypothetical protein [Candidatus Soleaferrea massiliensis]